jgi:hypothetical protein
VFAQFITYRGATEVAATLRVYSVLAAPIFLIGNAHRLKTYQGRNSSDWKISRLLPQIFFPPLAGALVLATGLVLPQALDTILGTLALFFYRSWAGFLLFLTAWSLSQSLSLYLRLHGLIIQSSMLRIATEFFPYVIAVFFVLSGTSTPQVVIYWALAFLLHAAVAVPLALQLTRKVDSE